MIDAQLWKKIDNFNIDESDAQFKFSERLARDNFWSYDFSQRVIKEYKKFIYLCCVANAEITPSDSVDQVWHLHLTYTKSYWIYFCKNTLEREIHHNPTKGGTAEQNKFNNCYDYTFSLYIEEFGIAPPDDIWLNSKQRFSEINFKRISLDRYWLVPKPLRTAYITSSILLATAGIFVLFIQSETPVPWFSLVIVFFLILFIIRGVKSSGRNKKKRRRSSSTTSGGGWWAGFWGGTNSDDHSGCSSHGCSSGCGGSGCGSGCGGH